MYSDKKKKYTRTIIAIVAAVLAAAAVLWSLTGGAGKNLTEESETAIREAIRRCALQCYVVEGVYPPDISYLEQNYGLTVNREDFYITYDAFASNLPPDIIVSRK